MGIMLMRFYADSIMMLALGGASSLVAHCPLWMLLVALAVPFASLALRPWMERWLVLATLAALVICAFATTSVTAFLTATLATLTATFLSRKAPKGGFLLVEFLLYVVSLMIFPLVAAHTPLAYLLQLLLLALVLATGLCVSLPYTPGHSHLPAPFPLALALCWLLFQ